MDVWSLFWYGTAAVFVLTNAAGGAGPAHDARRVGRVVAELEREPDPLLPAALLAFAVAWLVLFLVALGLQVLLWRPPYRWWQRRMRARAAAIVRRELGDEAYELYLANLAAPPIPAGETS